MAKTKYSCVYQDNKGGFFYQIELGTDRLTGKRIQKKGRKDKNGKMFNSAREAQKEVTRIRNEFLEQNGYSNYKLTYEEFMDNAYIPYYEAIVERSTWGF